MTATIRHLTTPVEAAAAVELQAAIWGSDEVAGHVLLAAAHNGGLLAGAFVEDRLAGFVWSFLGFDGRVHPPRLKHHSHMLGVHPDFRNHGLGFALKRFQWDYVVAQGIELITWTFDPLLATNAHLNIARLGAVCNTYRENIYGHLNDNLNAGLPSDRFQVDLWVNAPRVRNAMREQLPPRVLAHDVFWINPPSGKPGHAGYDCGPVPPKVIPDVPELPAQVALAIPLDFGRIKAADGAVAEEWRQSTGLAFKSLFAQGYMVVDFLRQPSCGCYLLARDFDRSS